MRTNTFKHFKEKLGLRSKNSFLYNLALDNWSLRGNINDTLLIKPADPWAGDASKGQLLLQGRFSYQNEEFVLYNNNWNPINISQFWLKRIHSFEWLRDLRALSGNDARQAALGYIDHWIKSHKNYHTNSWAPDITGMRLSMWISHYDFFCDAHDDDFLDAFFASIHKQARHLNNSISSSLSGIEALQALKGLLYVSLALQGHEKNIEKSLDLIKKQIDIQILGDGSHISRNPKTLMQSLCILLDVRQALAAAGYPLPDKIQHAIDRAGPALRFFIYGDKHMAVFNGSNETDENIIDSVLAQAGVRGKIMTSLPSCGYERVSQGRTLLLFDNGKSAAWPHDKDMHASPLSFEMAYGKDRIFVSCGTHSSCDEWNGSLRSTAAHNTLCVDHRNTSEIRPDGHLGRKVSQPFVKRTEDRKTCLIEASHDGYLPLNGITHSRRLFLCEQGTDLRGEDTLDCLSATDRSLDIAIRFHLHPRVLVSLVQNETEALLRLSNGVGWRFHHSGGTMALENSIYIGNGELRKTKQIVIYGQMSGEFAQVKWAVQREGL